jgi:hypothetical protein
VGEWDAEKCHFMGKCSGAMWPSRGLPCGSPLVKKIGEVYGGRTPDLWGHINDLAGVGIPTCPHGVT